MRVPPVSMFMSVLLSWRFFQHCGALSVRMQQLCSSRDRYIKELFFFLAHFFCCSFSSVRSQAEANSSPLSRYNLQKSASVVLSFILCAQISVKWPEIPFLLLPREALSQQALCGG